MADRGAFPSTWTVVLAHRQSARAALEALCSAYWYPIYAFIRRKGARPKTRSISPRASSPAS
jgi:RNA polymerase sigma-70 factor (ECF subfamily)